MSRSTFHTSIAALHSAALSILSPIEYFLHDALFGLLWVVGLVPFIFRSHAGEARTAHNQAVLVTGTSSGIGRQTAITLLRHGYIVFAGVRKIEDGEGLKSEVQKRGLVDKRLIPVELDVTDLQQIDRAFAAVSSYLSASNARLAAVINIAGGALCAPLEAVLVEDYKYLINLELVGRHEIARTFMPLIKVNRGRVVNVGSVGGFAFAPGFGTYHVVKAGLEAETIVLRREMAKFGVAVSLIEPGAIHTPAFARGISTYDPSQPSGFANYSPSPIPLDPKVALSYESLLHACAAQAGLMEKIGIPPSHVSEAIRHAIESPWPKERYLVGLDAKWMWWMTTLLPDWVRDVIGMWSW